MPVEVTSSEFQHVVLNAEQPVLVNFHAPWCQPQLHCHDDAVAERYRGNAVAARWILR